MTLVLKQTLLLLEHRVGRGRDRRDAALLGPSRGLTAKQDASLAAYCCRRSAKPCEPRLQPPISAGSQFPPHNARSFFHSRPLALPGDER